MGLDPDFIKAMREFAEEFDREVQRLHERLWTGKPFWRPIRLSPADPEKNLPALGFTFARWVPELGDYEWCAIYNSANPTTVVIGRHW